MVTMKIYHQNDLNQQKKMRSNVVSQSFVFWISLSFSNFGMIVIVEMGIFSIATTCLRVDEGSSNSSIGCDDFSVLF